MLQELLKDLQSSLKSYNQGLAKQNMLVDIPWTMVDGDLNIQRLIFRKDNSLYIVKEGEINESKWEYLAAMNSLVVEIGGKKILLNEVFADGKALILKKDGTSMNFLAFANQNELPGLNLIEYFNGVNAKTERLKIENEINERSLVVKEENLSTLFIWIAAIIMFTVLALVLVSK
jgi:hypothetical protein